MTEEIAGFPDEGLAFLKALEKNNNRSWFQENKMDYEKFLVNPALAFIVEFGEQLKLLSPGFNYDTRTSGSGSLMRIYRDIRFSKDKSPYHTYLRIRFWEGPGKAKDNPGVFLWIDGHHGGMHVGVHGFPKEVLAAYRDAVISDKAGAELRDLLDSVETSEHFSLVDKHYKKTPRGFPVDHPRSDLLLYNTLYASSPHIGKEILTKRKLLDVCMDYARDLLPLHSWLVQLYSRSSA